MKSSEIKKLTVDELDNKIWHYLLDIVARTWASKTLPELSQIFPSLQRFHYTFYQYFFKILLIKDDDIDLSIIRYLSCGVNKIKANIGIWKVLRKQKEEM